MYYNITGDSNTIPLDNTTRNLSTPYCYTEVVDVPDQLYEYLKTCIEEYEFSDMVDLEYDYMNKSILLKMFVSNIVVTCSISITGMKFSIFESKVFKPSPHHDELTYVNYKTSPAKFVLEAGVFLEFDEDGEIAGVVLRRKRNG